MRIRGIVYLVFIAIGFIVLDHRINVLQDQIKKERQDALTRESDQYKVVQSIQYEVDVLAESLRGK